MTPRNRKGRTGIAKGVHVTCKWFLYVAAAIAAIGVMNGTAKADVPPPAPTVQQQAPWLPAPSDRTPCLWMGEWVCPTGFTAPDWP